MKPLIALTCLGLQLVCIAIDSTVAMRISTWNLRFDSMPDNITVQQSLDSLQDPLLQPTFLAITEEQPWSTRRIQVAEQLLSSGISLASKYIKKCLRYPGMIIPVA